MIKYVLLLNLWVFCPISTGVALDDFLKMLEMPLKMLQGLLEGSWKMFLIGTLLIMIVEGVLLVLDLAPQALDIEGSMIGDLGVAVLDMVRVPLDGPQQGLAPFKIGVKTKRVLIS